MPASRPATPAPDPSLRQLLRQLWAHLASSAAEVLSLAAVLPFLAVLANPEGLWNQPMVQQWAPRLGIAGAQELLLPITIAFEVAALAAGAIRLLNLWLNRRLGDQRNVAIGSDLSCEAYRRTLPWRAQGEFARLIGRASPEPRGHFARMGRSAACSEQGQSSADAWSITSCRPKAISCFLA